MPRQYTQEQLDKIFEKLPEELQEALFSMETAEEVGQTCESYGITDERMGQISDLVGHVLMGLLLPQEFAGVLQKEVRLPKVLAQTIERDLNRLVFYPVKPALEQLHSMEVGAKAKEKEEEEPSEQPEEGGGEEKPEEPRGEDTYREQIE